MTDRSSATLRLPAGHHLLRWTALTPLNCGDTAGSAAVDRPVALDAWRALPYLPSAALKGVLAGRFGNVSQGNTANQPRQRLFGAPDDDEQGGGAASPLIFGDGEPLAFPLVLRDGRRAWVVVAATVYRLAALGLIEAPSLRRVEHEDTYAAPGAAGALPPLRLPLRPGRFGADDGLLMALAGGPGPFVLAAPQAAAALWQAAAEQRTLTALSPDRRVRSGSLRTVELIPAGAVFLSLVSNLTGQEAALGASAPLQLGAWESVGMGYVRAEVVPKGVRSGAGGDERTLAGATGLPPSAPLPSAPHEVMLRVFEAMQALQGRSEAPRVRSAIFDLGPRLKVRGTAATLAFCLAKAGGDEENGEEALRSRERRAYRWLLRQLFASPSGEGHAALGERVVVAIGGEEPLPVDFEPTRLWLRRYAETMLPREKNDA